MIGWFQLKHFTLLYKLCCGYTKVANRVSEYIFLFSDGIQGSGGEVGKKKKDESAEFAKRECEVLGERD